MILQDVLKHMKLSYVEENVPEPGIPESFRVLVKELQSLGMDVKILSDEKDEIEIRDLENVKTHQIVVPETVEE